MTQLTIFDALVEPEAAQTTSIDPSTEGFSKEALREVPVGYILAREGNKYLLVDSISTGVKYCLTRETGGLKRMPNQ